MTLFAKAVAISILAGLLAALPFAVLFAIGADFSFAVFAGLRYLAFGVGASLLVGLPISLVVFQIVRRDPNFMLHDLMLIANGVGVILAAVIAFWSGWLAIFFLGIPVIIAANVFAILGWRKILEPYQAAHHA